MTEELKLKAEEYVENKVCDAGDYSCGYLPSTVEEMLVEFATEATKELQEEISTLKHNKETVAYLGDCISDIQDKKIADLEEQIEELKKELEQAKKVKVVEHFEAYGQCRDSRRIAELEEKLEAMTKDRDCWQKDKNKIKELQERLNNQAISIGSYQEDLKKAEELLEAFLSFKNTTNNSREALEIMNVKKRAKEFNVRKRAKELVERIRNL